MKKHLRTSAAAIFALSISVTGAAAYASNDAVTPTEEVHLISAPIAVPISAPIDLRQIAITIDNEPLAAAGYWKPGGKEPMVPLRDVAEKLGLTVTWNDAEKTAEVTGKALWTIVKLGEDRYSVNKMYKELGTAPELTDSKTYVPASFVGEVLRAGLHKEEASIAITSVGQVKTALTKGVVTAVYENEGNGSIRINGIGTDGLVLNVGKDTEYVNADGTKLSLADMKLGMEVEAEHSLAMTLSLPPQTPTYKVTVRKQLEVKEAFGTAGSIEEVRTGDDGAVSLRIKGEGLGEHMPDEVVLRLTDKTELVDTNGEPVEPSELAKDAKVIGFYSGVLTRSLPPIGTASKIVLQAAPAGSDDEAAN